MFSHAVATGRKQYDQAIHWQQPLPEQDLSVEPSTVELIGPRSTREDIRGVYNDIYQLWRSPSKSPCDGETEENIHQKNLNSIKECLWRDAQPEERLRWSPAGASRPDPWAKFQDRVHAMYNHFRDLKEGSCEEGLAIV